MTNDLDNCSDLAVTDKSSLILQSESLHEIAHNSVVDDLIQNIHQLNQQNLKSDKAIDEAKRRNTVVHIVA
jgi:hypothetical protein